MNVVERVKARMLVASCAIERDVRLSELTPEEWGSLARAAIQAMREPDSQMLAAADGWTDLILPETHDNTIGGRAREFRLAWQAGIDAALKEGE